MTEYAEKSDHRLKKTGKFPKKSVIWWLVFFQINKVKTRSAPVDSRPEPGVSTRYKITCPKANEKTPDKIVINPYKSLPSGGVK